MSMLERASGFIVWHRSASCLNPAARTRPAARWHADAAHKHTGLHELRAAVHAMCRLLDHLAGCECCTLEECATKTAACSTGQPEPIS
jgi:hypothetical protein